MAFVNKYVTKEDIERYNLNELWAKYHEESWDPDSGKFPDCKDWTIDKERESWFIETAWVRDWSTDHQYTSEQIWTLHYQGTNIEVRLDYIPVPNEPNKFNLAWKLLSLTPDNLDNLSKDEMIELLREALNTFGYRGIRNQKPNTVVELRV